MYEGTNLTRNQFLIWTGHQLWPSLPTYNEATAFIIEGSVERERFDRAFQAVLDRTDSLRMVVREVSGLPMVDTRTRMEYSPQHLDLSGEHDPDLALANWIRQHAARPFDLAQRCFEAALIKLAEQRYCWYLLQHHMFSDATSMTILFRRVAHCYEQSLAGNLEKQEESPPYQDYLAFDRQHRRSSAGARAEAYWSAKLTDRCDSLNCFPGRVRDPSSSKRQDRIHVELSEDESQMIRSLAKRDGIRFVSEDFSVFSIFAAVLFAYLYRLSGNERIAIGVTWQNRSPRFAETVGLLMEQDPFQLAIDRSETFDSLIRKVHTEALEVMRHLPYAAGNPGGQLYNVALNFLKVAVGKFAGMTVKPLWAHSGAGEGNLVLNVHDLEGSGNFALEFDFNRDAFPVEYRRNAIQHFTKLLSTCLRTASSLIHQVDMLGESERRQLLEAWNDTQRDYPREQTVAQLFEAQAARCPDAVAVTHAEESLSYGELNARANALAAHLRALGVRPGVLVGLCVERSMQMMVGLLATLKAGGTYVPLDPAFPAERLAFMLADSQASVLLTQTSLDGLLSADAVQVVYLDRLEFDALPSVEDLPPVAGPGDLAYVLYTSGSTGKPKGVEVPHRALTNFLWSMRSTPGCTEHDVLMAITTLSFDIAGLELYLPLISGGRVELVSRAVAADGRLLRERLEQVQPTLLQATPATWRMLIEAGWQGTPGLTALIGGEALPSDLVQPLLDRTQALWNMYGPTETTIWSSVQRVRSAAEEITIGRPIANTTFYILDAALQPVPVGVPGELFIGGDGLAQGYRDRADLTAEKFIPHPFVSTPGARLYRTGDLARYRADGQVVHLGRHDQQVKIRGFRIELGEIEAALSACPGIGQAVVDARTDHTGTAVLAAYVVPAAGQAVVPADLRQRLRQTLPEYMVPQYFTELASLPLTPNGKVDRKRLPDFEKGTGDDHVALVEPRTPTELQVATIFAELLQVAPVDAHSNFFDLGGHSLLAIRLMSRLSATFKVELPLQTLFEVPTVAELAKRVDESLGFSASLPALRPAARIGSLPSSFAQQRLWFLDQLESGGAVYNIPVAYRLSGPLDAAALQQSLTEIVRRHEVLRTRFASEDGTPVQVISPAMDLPCPLMDVTDSVDPEDALQRLVNEEARRPFDVAKGPLIRARLLRVAADDHVLTITMHHIVSDGWSLEVFFKELRALYDAFRHGQPSPLPELPVQFADYAVWQREQLTGEVLERQRTYWRERLAGLGPLDLPADRPRPKRQTFRGTPRPLSISPELTAALKGVGRRENATLFMVTAAALQALLQRYTGQDDVAVGFPVANRSRAEVEGLIGFFVNTLVLRTDLSGGPTFAELLARVREAMLGAFAHQDLPFEKLVEEAQAERDLGRSPLFQVFFSMQGLSPRDISLGDLSARPLLSDLQTSKFDLSMYLGETAGRLQGFVEYNTDLFEAATIERLVGHYQRLLEGVAADAQARLSELAVLTEEERQRLLTAWNDTQRDYPREQTVAQLFEAQAARCPDAVAVTHAEESLSYGELNARANALAAHLRALGVRPGVLVGLCVERSMQMMVGLLATLKAGGTYVPLDPAFPAERLAFMLADSQASVLLTQTSLDGLLSADAVQVVYLDRLEFDALPSVEDLPPVAGPGDLAYVLYTSGSTGKPKGVEVPHRALTNFLWSMRSTPGCTEHDVLMAITTLSFDIAGLELYLPLISGGRVELVSRAVAADGRLLRERLEQVQPTLLQATPATWRMLIEAGWQGTPGLTALIGGEALPSDLVQPLLDRTQALWNMYGPTETTIWSSVQRVRSAAEEITIGRPIANTTFYILDAALQPVPVGVPGELFIGGDGLAQGYRDRADLTAEKFIPHPFVSTPGARLYRTGDLARYRADGQVVHLGRHDQQVKIRGFRIELGEIEAALSACPGIGQAVVDARTDHTGTAVLAAYVVPAAGQAVVPADLRQRLRQTLPEYMVPQYFTELASLPLTPNGKVDRKRLPDFEKGTGDDHVALVEPRTPTELQVATIFAELLQVAPVDAHSNFFDLGGHSLLAIRLMSRLSATFKVELPLQTLFEVPTVAGLSDRLCDRTGAARASSLRMEAEGARLSGPRTATEQRLASIWERILEVGPVGVYESFLRLQGSQNQLDAMLSEVRREFGVFAEGLPVSAFIAEPTVESLARTIDEARSPTSTLTVCLQPHGSKRPIFLIHAGGGYVFFYRALATRLGPHRPVYGVRAATKSDWPGPPFEHSKSVEVLAARYIEEIKSVQPRGPYTLGGACFGGVIAFEMARQLQAHGEAIAGPLLLFDSFVRDSEAVDAFDLQGAGYAVNRALLHLQRSSRLGPIEAVGFVLRKTRKNLGTTAALLPALLMRAWRKLKLSDAVITSNRSIATWFNKPALLEKAQLLTMERIMDATLRLLVTYLPVEFDGKIVLFKAANGPRPETGWAGLAREGIVVHEMLGVHLDMMEEPAVIETAALVTRYLDKQE